MAVLRNSTQWGQQPDVDMVANSGTMLFWLFLFVLLLFFQSTCGRNIKTIANEYEHSIINMRFISNNPALQYGFLICFVVRFMIEVQLNNQPPTQWNARFLYTRCQNYYLNANRISDLFNFIFFIHVFASLSRNKGITRKGLCCCCCEYTCF